jgi:2-oxoglutarate ferredoxin oxidoreductase subunit alpha
MLMDEVVGHMRENIVLPEAGSLEVVDRVTPTVPPEWYIPYENTPTGVPPMSLFGRGYRHHVTGLYHDQRGFPTLREDEVEPLINRLFSKISDNLRDIQISETYLMDDAEVAVIAYGSVARSAKRAVIEARSKGIKAGLLRLVTIWPFCRKAVESALERCRLLIVPEMNLGQISREVKRVCQGRAEVVTVSRVLGRLIRPDEILDAIEEHEK